VKNLPHRTRLARQIAPVNPGRSTARGFRESSPAAIVLATEKHFEEIARHKAVTPGSALQEETL
jgi:hypothetical protein